MTPILTRRAALAASLAASLTATLAGCAESPPPRTDFPPLRYDYLTPLGLNVATVDTEVRAYIGTQPGDVTTLAPIDPVAALRQLATDRLKPYGSSGRAVLAITEASLVRRAGGIEGTFGVELDIFTSGNVRAAYAEARVYRRIDEERDDLRGELYDVTKQLMDAMNVEVEYQIRRSLKDWLAVAPSAVPTPVQQQNLAPPPGAPPVAPPVAPPGTPPVNLRPPGT